MEMEVTTLHQCVICNEMFEFSEDLVDHSKIHIKIERDDAEDHTETDGAMDLQNYEEGDHNSVEQETFRCTESSENDCRPMSLPIIAPQRETIHVPRKFFDCEFCAEQFQFKADLEAHWYLVHSCQKQRSENVPQEIKIFNLSPNQMPPLPDIPEVKTEKNDSIETFHCKVCNSNFEFYEDLEKHCEMHYADDAQSNIEAGTVRKCSLCNATFTQQRNLERHVCHNFCMKKSSLRYRPEHLKGKRRRKSSKSKQANGKGKITAKACEKKKTQKTGKSGNSKVMLLANKSADATNSDSYIEIKSEPVSDSEDIVQSDKIKAPLKTVEPKPKPTCHICGGTFTQKSSLKTHMIIHTGEKNFVCGICGKAFSLSIRLKGHMRSHTGEKPYSCEVCGKSFSLTSSLRHHKQVHAGLKPFRCDFCNQMFSRKSVLVQHVRIHTGEKPFNCTICGKWFRHHSYLQTHMKIHFREKAKRGRKKGNSSRNQDSIPASEEPKPDNQYSSWSYI